MLTEESFQALRLCDASLTGITWLEAGRDLSIELVHASGRNVTLVCSWAHAHHIELKTPPQRGGHPLLWEATLASEGPAWRLLLDFGGAGEIGLLCNAVSLGGGT